MLAGISECTAKKGGSQFPTNKENTKNNSSFVGFHMSQCAETPRAPFGQRCQDHLLHWDAAASGCAGGQERAFRMRYEANGTQMVPSLKIPVAHEYLFPLLVFASNLSPMENMCLICFKGLNQMEETTLVRDQPKTGRPNDA